MANFKQQLEDDWQGNFSNPDEFAVNALHNQSVPVTGNLFREYFEVPGDQFQAGIDTYRMWFVYQRSTLSGVEQGDYLTIDNVHYRIESVRIGQDESEGYLVLSEPKWDMIN